MTAKMRNYAAQRQPEWVCGKVEPILKSGLCDKKGEILKQRLRGREALLFRLSLI
jgi:hypothetical protein